jgi:hypothetical protein
METCHSDFVCVCLLNEMMIAINQIIWCVNVPFGHVCLQSLSYASWAVTWLRQLVAGFLSWRSGFETGSVHIGFVADKVALDRIFSE